VAVGATMSEISDLDARLDQARTAYYDAIDNGQLDVADMAYAQMDALLKQRIHLPLPRQDTTIPALKTLAPKQ
ncbi:MAG: hypothetical protein ACXVGE_12985, partial [Blastococcus sp.]